MTDAPTWCRLQTGNEEGCLQNVFNKTIGDKQEGEKCVYLTKNNEEKGRCMFVQDAKSRGYLNITETGLYNCDTKNNCKLVIPTE